MAAAALGSVRGTKMERSSLVWYVQSPGLLCPLVWFLLGPAVDPYTQEECFWLLYNKDKHSKGRLLDAGWSLGQQ